MTFELLAICFLNAVIRLTWTLSLTFKFVRLVKLYFFYLPFIFINCSVSAMAVGDILDRKKPSAHVPKYTAMRLFCHIMVISIDNTQPFWNTLKYKCISCSKQQNSWTFNFIFLLWQNVERFSFMIIYCWFCIKVALRK